MVDISKYFGQSDAQHSTYSNGEDKTKSDASSWEDEFFHSAYISGKTRIEKQANNKKLLADHFQIRGVDYNLEEFYMMPYFKRQVLVRKDTVGKYENTVCFSYFETDEENRIKSSIPNLYCGNTSSERREVDWCKTCKTNIILIGFLCDENGNIRKNDKDEPINIFIRASKSKVGDIMQYFFDCQELSVPYLCSPDKATDETNKHEQNYFNIFRRIIKVSIDIVPTYNPNNLPNISQTRTAFKFEPVKELPPENIAKLLEYEEKINDKIKEKFDETEYAIKNFKKIKNKVIHEYSVFKNLDMVSDNSFAFNDPIPTDDNKTSDSNQSSSSSNDGGFGGLDDIPF